MTYYDIKFKMIGKKNIFLLLLMASVTNVESENGDNDKDFVFEYEEYDYDEIETFTLSPDLQYGSKNKTHLIPSHLKGVINIPNFNSSNGTSNSTLGTKLCGLPIFLDEQECCRLEATRPLKQCARPGVYIFAVFNVILGAVIIFGNSLLPIGIFLNIKLRRRYNYAKVSMSIADILIGFLVLIRIVPNSIAILQESKADVLRRIITGRNSFLTSFVGSLFMLNLQASSLHLLLMSVERAFAVYKPFLYRKVPAGRLAIACLMIWMMSLLFAFLPVIRRLYAYEYQSVWLISVLVFVRNADNSIGDQGIIYVLLTFVLPYLATVSFTVAAAVKIRRQLKSKAGAGHVCSDKNCKEQSSALSQNSDESVKKKALAKNRRVKMENKALETSAIMIASYSISTLPLVIVYASYNNGALTCSNYAIPWTLALYLRILNSIANFLVYTLREEEFKNTWQRVFRGKNRNLKSTYVPKCTTTGK